MISGYFPKSFTIPEKIWTVTILVQKAAQYLKKIDDTCWIYQSEFVQWQSLMMIKLTDTYKENLFYMQWRPAISAHILYTYNRNNICTKRKWSISMNESRFKINIKKYDCTIGRLRLFLNLILLSILPRYLFNSGPTNFYI
jgi:hypothetical protein